jgi:UDP-N-acetylmuramoyl-L-alanyl-D-glutamate--2,6-diaminopimelate ligase
MDGPAANDVSGCGFGRGLPAGGQTMKDERFGRRRPTRRMRVIAVAGTSGKTTTAWLTAAVLAEAGLNVGVISDLGCLGPDDDQPVMSRAASPRRFGDWLARLAAAGCSHAVVELAGRMTARSLPADLAFDTVVVTNLAGRRPALERSGKSGRSLAVRAVRSLRPDGVLVTGCAPDRTDQLARQLPSGCHLTTTGLADDCDVWATAVEGGLFGRTVVVSSGRQMTPLAVGTPTVSFVRDSLLAAAVGNRHGIPLDVAIRGIESAGTVPGRMERLDFGQDTPLFLDGPTSGHALGATLASLRRLTRGRLVVMAEEPLVNRIGAGHFQALADRHADACVIAPQTVLADDPADADVAAYARIDRLLDSLGADDCGLVLGGVGQPGPPPGRFPLAMLVDAWLQISQAPASPGRRAA